MYFGKQTSFSLADCRRRLRTTRAASKLFGQTELHCSQPIQLHKRGACSASATRPSCTSLIRAVGLVFLKRAGHTAPHLPHCSQRAVALTVARSRKSVSLKSVISVYRFIMHHHYFYLKGLGPSFISKSPNL